MAKVNSPTDIQIKWFKEATEFVAKLDHEIEDDQKEIEFLRVCIEQSTTGRKFNRRAFNQSLDSKIKSTQLKMNLLEALKDQMKESRICPTCKGKGRVTSRRRDLPPLNQDYSRICMECGGKGKIQTAMDKSIDRFTKENPFK